MADSNPGSKIDSAREWIIEHKLRSVARHDLRDGLRATGNVDDKQSLAQMNMALTLAALAGAAVVEYYDHKTGAKSERYAKFLDSSPHKD
ncbi:hypothetical protein E3N88_35297 [Mikania micrantha]|uniref:HIG1 domain-containing protein n=1 Tax=Mikania micrantha TaxID=192012 RepID=A0A5N6M0K9_9ASTR|nr:hypothetical protein E3N88_35297 [Mikania micrantha]